MCADVLWHRKVMRFVCVVVWGCMCGCVCVCVCILFWKKRVWCECLRVLMSRHLGINNLMSYKCCSISSRPEQPKDKAQGGIGAGSRFPVVPLAFNGQCCCVYLYTLICFRFWPCYGEQCAALSLFSCQILKSRYFWRQNFWTTVTIRMSTKWQFQQVICGSGNMYYFRIIVDGVQVEKWQLFNRYYYYYLLFEPRPQAFREAVSLSKVDCYAKLYLNIPPVG